MTQNLSEAMLLWQSATPIQIARTKYASPELLQSLELLPKVSIMDELQKVGVANLNNGSLIQAMNEATQTAVAATDKHNDIQKQIDQDFFNALVTGQFRSFAFELPRSLTSIPVELRPEHWTAYPNWQTGEFKANGLHLIELRVLKAEKVADVIGSAETTKVGRPSIEPHVTAAFAELNRLGKIDVSKSAVSHFPLIREWINRHDPKQELNALHLGKEGIRAHFSPLFKALKKTRKQ